MRLFLLLVICLAFPVDDVVAALVRYVSREDPLFNGQAARMPVGRVYLWHEKYVLRINRDGTQKLGSEVTYALTAATANSDGVIATGNAHFNHSVNLWSPKFERLGAVNDFLNNDQVEYFAPGDVQAGGTGDFFGLDQNRNRILRVAVPDRLVTAFSLADAGEDLMRRMARFRVWEAGKRFYLLLPNWDAARRRFRRCFAMDAHGWNHNVQATATKTTTTTPTIPAMARLRLVGVAMSALPEKAFTT